MSNSLWEDATPPEIKNAKGLHLVVRVLPSPNAQKVEVMLEELKDVYATEWTTTTIDTSTKEQKKDWYLRLNPNGRIPLIVDNTHSPPHTVRESSAEVQYLLEFYDKDTVFGFADKLQRSEALQWLFFWHGSGAPSMTQLNHFGRTAEEKLPYAIEHFRNEVMRVVGVLEIRLSGKYTGEPRDYLVGSGKGKYSVAEIGSWPYLRLLKSKAFPETIQDQFPHVMKWIDRIAARPAAQRAVGGTEYL